ncbi:MAG: cytochrome P460 family protein [Terriglobales bacterium]
MRFTSVVLAITFACGAALANDKLNMQQPTAPMGNESQLLLPANYRNWVALAPTVPGMPAHRHKHLVSKVYVEPMAYESFLRKGSWPNHTLIVLELCDKATPPKTICDGMIGLEVAAKDEARLPDPWSYYGIIYDHKQPKPEAKPLCADCGSPTDMRLAMYFLALRAVIDGNPQTMQPAAF